MENFRRNGGQGGWNGGNKFGGKKPWMGGGSDDRGFSKPSYRATCAACGNACEVPFKPNGSKPVYCRDCFKKEGNGGMEQRRFDRPESRSFDGQEKRMYEATCDKCGSDCEVPFRPTGEKPVYCRDCFKKDGTPMRGASCDHAAQFAALSAKLDAVLKALAPAAPAKAPAAEKVVEKAAEEEPKKAAKKKPVAKKKK